MMQSVGPLLFGLGLCAVSGCASVGAGRSTYLPSRGAPETLSRVRTAKTAPEVTVDRADSAGAVSFRAPQRSQDQPANAGADGSAFAGHSSELKSKPSANVPGERDAAGSPLIPTGLPFNSSAAALQVVFRSPDSIVDASSVVDANFRSGRDGSDNAVQLQGLQEETPRMVPDASAAPGPWQPDLDRLIARAECGLAAMSAGTNEYRRQQVHLRLLYLVARSPERALTAIPSLDPADQEYWQQIVLAITNSLDAEEQLSARERAAQTLPPVNKALRQLREQADLTIRNSAFCEEISYFGNYKRFPREEFVPGQPVLLYAEIENFRSEPMPDTGEYRTLLKSRIEIVGPDGKNWFNKNFAATEDLCRNPRRDYFHNYQFTIPERLRLGPHTLKLTVVDELSGKEATCAIKFMVK